MNTTSLQQLTAIKSYGDLAYFITFLSEHKEVESVQGWQVLRSASGNAYGLKIGKIVTDAKELFAERRSLNDWIKGYKSGKCGAK